MSMYKHLSTARKNKILGGRGNSRSGVVRPFVSIPEIPSIITTSQQTWTPNMSTVHLVYTLGASIGEQRLEERLSFQRRLLLT